jgi:hypothetical protein
MEMVLVVVALAMALVTTTETKSMASVGAAVIPLRTASVLLQMPLDVLLVGHFPKDISLVVSKHSPMSVAMGLNSCFVIWPLMNIKMTTLN